MSDYPKITIITPSYNQGQFLEQTIRSVLDQNYPSLEYILMDGGSTDNSVQIIEKYSNRISHWVSEKDAGTFDAINKALRIFTGNYWCVVNSDDLLEPGSLETISNQIKASGADWLTGGVKFIDADSTVIGKSIPVFPPKVDGKYFYNECWIYHPVTFLSRALFEKVGYFNKMDIMDYDYWIRAEKLGFLPVVYPVILGSLRYHVNCKSMDFLKIYRSKIDLLTAEDSQPANNQMHKHLEALELSYFQSELKLLLFNKKYSQTISKLLKGLLRQPALLKQKWVYGLMKRFVTGIHESEVSPLYFLKNLKV